MFTKIMIVRPPVDRFQNVSQISTDNWILYNPDMLIFQNKNFIAMFLKKLRLHFLRPFNMMGLIIGIGNRQFNNRQ